MGIVPRGASKPSGGWRLVGAVCNVDGSRTGQSTSSNVPSPDMSGVAVNR
jgi:hypothetical protein